MDRKKKKSSETHNSNQTQRKRREQRLANALRDNLRRRKIRQRNSQALEPHEPGVSPPQNRTEDTK